MNVSNERIKQDKEFGGTQDKVIGCFPLVLGDALKSLEFAEQLSAYALKNAADAFNSRKELDMYRTVAKDSIDLLVAELNDAVVFGCKLAVQAFKSRYIVPHVNEMDKLNLSIATMQELGSKQRASEGLIRDLTALTRIVKSLFGDESAILTGCLSVLLDQLPARLIKTVGSASAHSNSASANGRVTVFGARYIYDSIVAISEWFADHHPSGTLVSEKFKESLQAASTLVLMNSQDLQE
jgi:hypothetical protein